MIFLCWRKRHSSRQLAGMTLNFNFRLSNLKFSVIPANCQIRAQKMGFKIYYAHQAKIWHKDSMTIGKSSPFKAFYDVRNSLVVRLKHRDAQYLKKYIPWYLKNTVLVPFIKNLIRFRLNHAKSVFEEL